MSHEEKIAQLEATTIQAVAGYAHEMGEGTLRAVASSCIAQLPGSFLVLEAANRIEGQAFAAVMLGLVADIETARQKYGQAFCSNVHDTLKSIVAEPEDDEDDDIIDEDEDIDEEQLECDDISIEECRGYPKCNGCPANREEEV